MSEDSSTSARPRGRRRRASRLRRALLAVLVLALATAATAQALHLQIGDLVVEAEGGFAPRALPRAHDAPIKIHGGGKISTESGALPPVLRKITLLYDRHGSLQTKGLAVCTRGQAPRHRHQAGPPRLPRRDRRHRLGHRGDRLPRFAPDPRHLADHPLQRPPLGSAERGPQGLSPSHLESGVLDRARP